MSFRDLIFTMLSITDLLEKIPSAKMDEGEESIRIPIREYENFRNMSALHDKQSIIKDLQVLLLNKEADLQRYKEKCEQTESVLQRTQKALDKRLHSEQSQHSIPLRQATSRSPSQGIIPLKKSDSRGKENRSDNVGVISRAVGSRDTSNKAEDPIAASLPNNSSRPGGMEDCQSLKSLPLSLSIGSPGMSAALFKRLVQENLRLKSQLEKKSIPKLSKDPEKAVNDLKLKLERKQQLIEDMGRSNSEGGHDHLTQRIAALHKENEKCNEMIEMEKIIIESLKQENNKIKKEKEEFESLLKQHSQVKISTQATDEKISELENKIRAEIEKRKSVESKLDSCQTELERMKQTLEKTEQERDLLQTNYNTLCTQYHKTPSSTTMQPAYKVQPSQLPPTHTVSSRGGKPSSPQLQHRFSLSTTEATTRYQQAPPLPRRPSEGLYSRTSLQSSPVYVQPQQESMTHKPTMSQSVYTPPTYQTTRPQSPAPSERKTFKCPRCDLVFTVLQGYRDHIKICLKG